MTLTWLGRHAGVPAASRRFPVLHHPQPSRDDHPARAAHAGPRHAPACYATEYAWFWPQPCCDSAKEPVAVIFDNRHSTECRSFGSLQSHLGNPSRFWKGSAAEMALPHHLFFRCSCMQCHSDVTVGPGNLGGLARITSGKDRDIALSVVGRRLYPETHRYLDGTAKNALIPASAASRQTRAIFSRPPLRQSPPSAVPNAIGGPCYPVDSMFRGAFTQLTTETQQ
jgi:hypothetical protein